jgi:hypothetical protein
MMNSDLIFLDIEEYLKRELKPRKRPICRAKSNTEAHVFLDAPDEMLQCCRKRIAPSDELSGLESYLKKMDQPFSKTLFNYIDKAGIDDVECYKRAYVDKKIFSKIKCNADYRPSKKTAVSFALALRLNLEETAHLLKTAGYALSKSSIFDLIIEYFIKTGYYETIDDVNMTLYRFDQPTLGV